MIDEQTIRIKTNQGPVITVSIDIEKAGTRGFRVGDNVWDAPWSNGVYYHPSGSGVESSGIALDDWYPFNGCIIIEDEWESESLTSRIIREEDNKVFDELYRNSFEEDVIAIESET